MFTPKKISLAVAGCFLASAPAMAQDEIDYHVLSSPVVVTATRVEQNSFDLPVSIDVIDGEVMRDNQQQVNLSETAARIPGVVVSNRYNLAQDLSVSTRGFGARSAFGVRGVRLYMDGIPLTMPDGQGQTGTFNLDTARQIEYLRGPFSALYGNSSGGVVQILTKDGTVEPTLSGGITFGSYGTHRETLSYSDTAGDVNYLVNAAHYSTDGFRDHSSGTRDTLHGKVTFTPSQDTKVTLVATALDQPDTEDPQGLTWAEYRDDPSKASPTAISRNVRLGERRHVQAGITLDQHLNENHSVRLMGYTGIRKNLQFLPTSVSGIDRDFWGVDARWIYRDTLAGGPLTLTAGLNYDDMEDDRKGYGLIIPSNTQGALNRNETQSVHNFDQYIQATWEPGARWLLSAGLRHTRIKFEIDDKYFADLADSSGSVSYTNTSPVFGVTFRLTPAVNLYANAGKGFETPTFIETTYSDTAGNGPNSSIQPSKSWNYEVGVKAFVGDNTRVNLALFDVQTEKEIVVDASAGGKTVYTNAGDTERYGLELSLDSVLPNNFNFYAAYTLMSAEFKDDFKASIVDGNKIPGTYTSTTYAELSWKYAPLGFSTAIEGLHRSKAYTNDTNTGTADAYTLFNWRGGFTQSLKTWKFNEFVRVENLFDQKYISSIRVNDSFGRFYEPGADRNVTVGVNASYQF